MMRKLTVAVVALLSVCLTVRADEPAKTDNPLYTGWAKYKEGSSMTMEVTMPATAATPAKTMTVKSTLKSLTADTATIESTDAANHTFTRKIPAKITAGDTKQAGEEDVAAMGKTFKCTVCEMKAVADGESGDDTATVYLSDEVVGGMVKLVAPGPGGSKIEVKLTSSDPK
jgi:hypothetical protein